MKTLLVAAAAAIAFVGKTASACSCAPVPLDIEKAVSAEQAAELERQWAAKLKHTPNVFVAQVDKLEDDPKADARQQRRVILGNVRRVLGTPPKEGFVFNDPSCPRTLQPQQVYLFYTDNTRFIGMCTARPVSEAEERSVTRAARVQPPN